MHPATAMTVLEEMAQEELRKLAAAARRVAGLGQYAAHPWYARFAAERDGLERRCSALAFALDIARGGECRCEPKADSVSAVAAAGVGGVHHE